MGDDPKKFPKNFLRSHHRQRSVHDVTINAQQFAQHAAARRFHPSTGKMKRPRHPRQKSFHRFSTSRIRWNKRIGTPYQS